MIVSRLTSKDDGRLNESSLLHRVSLRCPLISSLKWTRRTLFDIVRVEVMMGSLVEVVRPVGHHPHPEE
jgi:hypothetical protein